MFKDLRNEAKITFKMKVDSPLSIRSGSENGIDPTLPDMQCLRTFKDGENTVFIPGSSIKGVIRSRCERIIKFLEGNACNIVDRNQSCNGKEKELKKELTGSDIYKKVCHACRIFGSTAIGSRVKFKDAYPIGKTKIGFRNGVGINRITGAAQRGALYDFEVVEDGTFEVSFIITNYELYQLKLLLFAIEDIDEGYVSFGGSTTRGNGKMKVEDLTVEFRDYRKNIGKVSGFKENDKGKDLDYKKEFYFYKAKVDGLDSALDLLENVDLEQKIAEG